MRPFFDFVGAELGIVIAFIGDGDREISTITKIADPARARCRGEAIVKVDPRYYRPTEVETRLGEPTKARKKLGWTQRTSLRGLVAEMVAADYRADDHIKNSVTGSPFPLRCASHRRAMHAIDRAIVDAKDCRSGTA